MSRQAVQRPQCSVLWGVHRQRQVDKQFAQEEIAAGLAVEHQGVLADPAQAGLFGDGFFQHRGAVDEGAKPNGPICA
jgi:hypothetical protein